MTQASYSSIPRQAADLADSREAEYGDYLLQAERACVINMVRFGWTFTPIQHFQMMQSVKDSRQLNKWKEDSSLDSGNYQFMEIHARREYEKLGINGPGTVTIALPFSPIRYGK